MSMQSGEQTELGKERERGRDESGECSGVAATLFAASFAVFAD